MTVQEAFQSTECLQLCENQLQQKLVQEIRHMAGKLGDIDENSLGSV